MIETLMCLILPFLAADRATADRLFTEGQWAEARTALVELNEAATEAGERGVLEERIGETYLWEGDLWEAETWFARSIESEDSALARLRRGQVYFYAGQRSAGEPGAMGAEVVALMNDAITQLRQALKLDPGSAEALVFIGLCERYRKNPAAEEAAYRAALELEPGRPDASLDLAWVLDTRGELAEARQVLSRVDTAARNFDIWLYESRLARKAGDRETEVAAAEQAVLAAPDRNDGYLALWNATGFDKRFNEFEAAMKTVLAEHPEESMARYYLGFCLRCARRPEEAVEMFRSAVERNPEDTRAILAMAETLREDLKREDEATEVYLELLRIEPENQRALQVLSSLAKISAVQGDLERAERLFKALAKAEPGQWIHTLNLALIEKERNRPEAALALYRAAEEKFPFEPQIPNDRGLLLMGMGRTEEAQAAFAAALDRDPEFLDSLENLGGYALLAGHPEEAIKYFRRAYDRVRSEGGDATKFRRYLDLAARAAENGT